MIRVYKAKVAVCSEIRTKHSTEGEYYAEFFNFKPDGTQRNVRAWKG